MYGFFLQWLFQSAARDVINFIHTLWMLCPEKKGEKRVRNDVRSEGGSERERPRERERKKEKERRYGVAEEDFQCSCMYNE